MFERFMRWWLVAVTIPGAVWTVSQLEDNRKFITPFFVGESMRDRLWDENERKIKAAKERLARLDFLAGNGREKEDGQEGT